MPVNAAMFMGHQILKKLCHHDSYYFLKMINNFGQNSRENQPCLHLSIIVLLGKILVYIETVQTVLAFCVKCNQKIKLDTCKHI